MKLTWERRDLHLKHPFRIARRMDGGTDKQVLLVRIEHDGHTGWGECAPISFYHQSLDSNEAALATARELLGNDPFALDAVLGRLWDRVPNETAAISAVDGALHDLCGKILGIPVWKWFGLDPKRIPLTSMTIGIDEPEIMAKKVREVAEFPILKVKIGTDRDDEILTTIRREAPKKIVRVDANCGWTKANAMERCRKTAAYNVEFIEQPTQPEDHACLAEVKAARITPLIADESCTGVEGVLKCVPYFDGINIKLSKCGGIRRAVQMIHTARSAGLKIMIGCMVETSVGISAAAQLGPMVDYLDLDGHMLLADDPFEGIGGAAGKLTLTDAPGLGVRERRAGKA